MKGIRILLTVLILSAVSFAQTFTLQQAIEYGLKHNDRIRQFDERLYQKRYANYAAWGNFLPEIKLDARYTHLNAPLDIDLNFLREGLLQMQTSDQVQMANLQSLILNGRPLTPEELSQVQQLAYSSLNKALPPFNLHLKDQNFKTATLTAVQPLFLGGKLIAAKKFASAEKSAAEQELQKTRNEITREIVNRYLTVVMLKAVVRTRKDVLKGMQLHQKQAEALFKQGLIARTDVLRARVAVAEARRRLFDDQKKLELAKIALKQSMGLDENESLVLTDSLRFKAFNDSLAQLLKQAQKTQPVFQLLKAKEKAAAQKLTVERAEFLPQLAAFGKYEMYPEYLSILEPRWVVGLNLQLNLFNGFKKYNRVQQARHLKKEVHFLKKEVERKIQLWIHQSYRKMRNARQEYFQLAADIDLARENLTLQEKRFQTGLSTSLDVIDARLILEKEQIARYQALFQYYMALNDLFTAVGEPLKITTVWN